MTRRVIGVGHHPFSKKYEFKGYFDAPTPSLIATDYKAPKTVLEVWDDNISTKENDIMSEYIQPIDRPTVKGDFTFVELFAGIGGVSFGFERLGGECVLAAEFDPERKGKRQFAQEAYKILHPNVPMTGDVFELDAEDVPDHDVLSFTFPCQAFSLAGKRGGFDDARGTLVFESLRIANEKRPKVLFAENVKGLVNHDKGNTLDTIIRAMNDIGYVVDFDIMNSKYFGVPQNRERVFIVAVREDLIEAEPFSEESTTGQTVIPKAKRRMTDWAVTFNFDWPEQGEVTTRLRDVLEPIVDEKYYLDDERTAKLVAQLEERNNDEQTGIEYDRRKGVGDKREVALYLSASDWRGLNRNQKQTAVAEIQTVGNVNPSGRSMNGAVYDINAGLSPSLTTNKGEGVKMFDEVRPVLTPDRINKRQDGRRFKDDDEESFTLTSQDRHGVALGSKPRYRIRKLTPKECFRLQAFSDEAHQSLVDAGISDSQRYKMAGNAVTVSVIEALGERILPLLA